MACVLPSLQDGEYFGAFPDTSFLANFRLSLSGRLFAEAGAQIFFQPGEGGFNGGAVLPVGEIGEVIFAGGFRQSFAGGGSQTFPRGQGFHVRQLDWKKVARISRRSFVKIKQSNPINYFLTRRRVRTQNSLCDGLPQGFSGFCLPSQPCVHLCFGNIHVTE